MQFLFSSNVSVIPTLLQKQLYEAAIRLNIKIEDIIQKYLESSSSLDLA